MSTSTQGFIDDVVDQVRPLYVEYTRAAWEAATTGSDKANRREQEAQVAMMRYWADPGRHAEARRLHESGAAGDALQARQVRLIFLSSAKAQQDEETIQRLAQLEAEVRQTYYNFRGRVGGQEKTDNELDEILAKSAEGREVCEAWEASKQIGAEVAERVRELARVRNRAAQAQGFRDHFQKSLLLDEIDENELLDLFARLEAETRQPYAALKARIDGERARRFRVSETELRPWHFGDRFFQRAPQMGALDMDAFFAGQDPVALATATYDGLGLPVGAILARSDLYPRPGKNQHAFCIDIDRQGDVRTLNNLVPNHHWNETLLHELGHAVYDASIDPGLPWLLREPPHTLSTEAIALLMGGLTYDQEWLTSVAGVPAAEAAQAAQAARERERAARLIFTRWCLVMTYFELALYADPERELDGLWWDLVERYQLLRRPDGRRAADWASKYHVALAPVYYHNYELGYLCTAQLEDRVRRIAGGLVGRPQAGAWLVDKFFRPGARQDWAAHIAQSTGEALNPRYFVESLN